MRIATFNVQNLRLRHPGGRSRLDGARDKDATSGALAEPSLDYADRRLTARLIALAEADVVCLQEVFDAPTLDFFHDHYLLPAGAGPYPYRICVPGNDGGGRDVAILARQEPAEWRSHADLLPADLGLSPPEGIDPSVPVFRRDCLVARFGELTIFLCHFKAPWPDAQAAWPVRRLEALAVRKLVEQRHADPSAGLWMVAGDLNEPVAEAGEAAIAPLSAGFAIDLASRIPAGDRWTWFDNETGLRSSPDRLLVSPALAARFPQAVPKILRAGMSRAAGSGERLEDAGPIRPHASDHALVTIEFEGL